MNRTQVKSYTVLQIDRRIEKLPIGWIRISVEFENAEDIIEDVGQGLAKVSYSTLFGDISHSLFADGNDRVFNFFNASKPIPAAAYTEPT